MLVSKVLAKVKAHFSDQEGSHDWFHIERVWKMSLLLHQKEGGDKELIELCALLHDISDHKYNGGDFLKGGQVAKEWILACGGSLAIANRVAEVIPGISYKGAEVTEVRLPIEGVKSVIHIDLMLLVLLVSLGLLPMEAAGKGRCITLI